MPNYSLNTTGAQFKPFSFQEIIAPYEMMRTAEEKLQNDYIQMSDQVGEWQAAVESSPTLSARLQNYQDKVRAASDKLAATGKLDRGAFFELRKQMTAQIAPIKKAVTEYNKAIELDTKMRAADGTYIAKRQVPTLEDFANGDNRYSGGISGNAVLTRAAAAGKELSKEQRAVIDSFAGNKAFVKLSQETGIPVEQLTLQAIKSGNAPKEVLDVYNSLRDSIGYNDYDQTGKDMIDSNIQLGLLSASTERREAFQRNPHDEWVSQRERDKDLAEINVKTRVLGYEYTEDASGKMQIRQLTPEEHKAALQGYRTLHSKSGNTTVTTETTSGGYPKVEGSTSEEREASRLKILNTMGLRSDKSNIEKLLDEDASLEKLKEKLIEKGYYDKKQKTLNSNIEIRFDGGKNRYTIVYKDPSEYRGYLKIATIDENKKDAQPVYNARDFFDGDVTSGNVETGGSFENDKLKQTEQKEQQPKSTAAAHFGAGLGANKSWPPKFMNFQVGLKTNAHNR